MSCLSSSSVFLRSFAFWYLCSRSFARHRSMTRASSRGIRGFRSLIDRGVSLRIEDSTETAESPVNGRWPVAIS